LEQAAKKIVSLSQELSNRTLGTDELNICEFPLTSTGRAASQHENTLVFEDEIYDEGSQESVRRKLMVSASEAFGLPTPADSDVLLVLMHVTNLRNGFSDRTVHFTRYELVKALGWDDCGKSYRRIEESLQRWVNITLNYNRAWWDRDGQRWQNKSFHILESIDLRGRGDALDDGTSSFTWNQVIFDSVQANHVKRLDLDTYFRLKSPTARQAYRFLDKRFYRSKHLEFDLRVFACEHVGLSRSYDIGQLKRKLRPAIEELEQIRFLKVLSADDRYVKRQRNEWLIRLIRESEAAESAAPALIEESSSLEGELVSRGLHASTARELVAGFLEERIREKISVLEFLITKGGERTPKNPAGWLAAAVREDYKPPSDYRRVPKQPATPIVGRSTPQRIESADSSQEARLIRARSYFRSLPAEDQLRLESLALSKGNRFRVDTYNRVKSTGGPLFEEVRDLLIADLIDSEPEMAAQQQSQSVG
jgi:plasmid replication initiation protein